MSYWSYCHFRLACLRQPFIEAFEALKESGILLLLVLGAALPAAAFTMLYGFGLLFDSGTGMSSLMLTSWLILLLQTLWIALLRSGILGASYKLWFACLPTPSWLVYMSHFVLCSFVNIMLWPILIILLNIELAHWHELGHIFVFLLIQLALGLCVLSMPKAGGTFIVLGYVVTQLGAGLADASVLSGSTVNLVNDTWFPSWALIWMLILFSLFGVCLVLPIFADKAYGHILRVNTHINATAKQKMPMVPLAITSVGSSLIFTHLAVILSWVKHELASLIFRGALILLLINLADLVQFETVSGSKDLSQYISSVLLLFLLMISASWQFTIRYWLQRNVLFLKSLPVYKFVQRGFMLLPGLLFLSSLGLASWSTSAWLKVSGSELVILGVFLILLQFLTQKWPKLFIVWFALIAVMYGFLKALLV